MSERRKANMLALLKKNWQIITFILLLLLLASFFLFPIYAQPLCITLFSLSIGSAIIFTVHRHWRAYKQGETTRPQMTRDLILDLLGLGLTLAAAVFVGRLAGGYFGIRAGFWIGILTGFAGGFVAAWVVRSGWEKLSRA